MQNSGWGANAFFGGRRRGRRARPGKGSNIDYEGPSCLQQVVKADGRARERPCHSVDGKESVVHRRVLIHGRHVDERDSDVSALIRHPQRQPDGCVLSTVRFNVRALQRDRAEER